MVDEVSWTVVITTFNRPALLKRAIESCIAQTEPCEIVVVDDCSADETPTVIAQFPQVAGIRNDTNLGHSVSANRGIRRATRSWVKHLDDDDYLHPDCLRKMSEAIRNAQRRGYEPKIVTCISTNVDIRETPLGRTRSLATTKPVVMRGQSLLAMMMRDQAPLGTPIQVAHDRQAALDVGGWNEHRIFNYRTGDEAEFWIKLAPLGDAIFLPDALAYRTKWSGNEAPPHTDRLEINLFLKGKISEHLNKGQPLEGRVPPDIERYLNLFWGLVALKDGKILTGLKLALRGMFHVSSYRYIRGRSSFVDAIKLGTILD